jgi:cold shock CspA family protein/tRNA A-37 threonylcarbamoyl transferase component Bud32
MSSTTTTGRVQFFKSEKQFGFILGDDGTSYFVHSTDVEKNSLPLVTGQRVEFIRSSHQKGPRAKSIRVLEPVPSLVPAKTKTKAAPLPQSSRTQVLTPGFPVALQPSSPEIADTEAAARTLGIFMGLVPGTPSFTLGNSLVRSQGFRYAARELFDRAEGRQGSGEEPKLARAVATLLCKHAVTKEPGLTQRLNSLEQVLVPFFKLAVPQASQETHRAVLELFRATVRAAVHHSGLPSQTQRIVTPPIPPPAAPRKEVPPTVLPQAAHGTLLAQVSERRVELAARHLTQLQDRTSHLETALQLFRNASFHFASGIQLSHAWADLKHEVEDALETIRGLIAQSEDASNRHQQSLKSASILMHEASVADLPPSVMDELIRPVSAARVAQLIAASSLSEGNVPAWLLPRWFGTASSLRGRMQELLARPEACQEALAFMEWLGALSVSSRRLLLACREPPSGASLVDFLKSALEELLEQQRNDGQWKARIAALKDFASETLLANLGNERTAEAESLLSRTETLLRRMNALEGSIGPTTLDELRMTMRSWPENKELPAIVDAVEFAVTRLGDFAKVQPSLSTLLGLAEKLRPIEAVSPKSAVDSKPQTPVSVVNVSVVHPLSRVQSGRTNNYDAELSWVLVPGQPFGVVRFPVRLKFDVPMEREGEWLVEIATDLLNNVPEEWRRQFLTSIPLRASAGTIYKDFTVEIPISKRTADLISSENRNISITFDVSRGGARSQQRLHWQGLQRELPAYQSPFPLTASKREMDLHPLGVERDFKKLRDLIAQGRKSFRVHGPRRMGKTTLIRALREYFFSSTSVALVESVVASQYRTAAEVWEAIGRKLSDAFNRPVNLGKTLPPSEDAFNAIREAAREKGYSAMYVLIDEAQALFTLSGEPHRLGEALKARLESEWGRASESRAALLLGLVGQAHLPELMGGNLTGAISDAVTADGIRADELLPLLRTHGNIGLQSTTEAREALARQSGNLWILDRLLDRVATSCIEEGRPWFTEEDVEKAVQRLVEADDAGTETTLWSYVRDVLNENDDKNIWRPSETYPVAMAWARVRAMGGEAPKTRAEKVEYLLLTLQDWSRDFDIKKQRVEEAFSLLQRQRVLRKEDTFDLPLLERLLLVRSNITEPFSDEVDRRSLSRLGLNRLVTPAAEESEVSAGGQANVYPGSFEGKLAAVRKVRLVDSKAEQRFIREVALLDRLRDASGDAVRAAQLHLPRLFATGVDPAVPDVGLVVYEWIVGAPLEERQLTADGCLLVLLGLAKALAALRHCGIVHRDIRPANVLIRQNKGEPVLIDFGLSVAIDDIPKTTALAGVVEYLPPEVKERGASAWSPAGDVYSAGRTLEDSLTLPDRQDSDVKALLASMMAKDPDQRPSPTEVSQRVEHLVVLKQVRQRNAEFQARFSEALAGLAPPLRTAILSSSADYAAALGGMTTQKMRILQVAEFLENLTQAKLREDHSGVVEAIEKTDGRTFLRALPSQANLPQTLRALAECGVTRSVGLLRNAAAHPYEAEAIMKRAYSDLPLQLKNSRPYEKAGLDALQGAVETVADRVAILTSRPEVRKVVREWVSARAER